MEINLAIAIAAISAAAFLMLRGRGVKAMPTEAILEKIRSGASIIDVRSPEEYSDGAYPKAKNVPLASLPSRLEELGPKAKPIIVYCASGMRSAQAAAFLKKAGYTQVINAGGLGNMPRSA